MAWLAGIPNQWQATGDLSRFYMCLRTGGAELQVEEASYHGRADMVVKTGGQIFVIEFKMAEGVRNVAAIFDTASRQMRPRGYADRYRDCGRPVHLLGVSGGRAARTLPEVRAERLAAE